MVTILTTTMPNALHTQNQVYLSLSFVNNEIVGFVGKFDEQKSSKPFRRWQR